MVIIQTTTGHPKLSLYYLMNILYCPTSSVTRPVLFNGEKQLVEGCGDCSDDVIIHEGTGCEEGDGVLNVVEVQIFRYL